MFNSSEMEKKIPITLFSFSIKSILIKTQKLKILSYLSLALGVLCISFSAIFVKFSNSPGIVSAFYRLLISGFIIVPWWLFKKTKLPSVKEIHLILLGGIFFALDLTFWNTSLTYTTAATSTLLVHNAPLWVGLGALIFFHERLHFGYWLGLAISIIGMVVLVGIETLKLFQLNIGDILSIIASIFYAAYLLITQKIRSKIDTLTFMTLAVVSGIIILFIINIVSGTKLTGYSMNTWASFVGLGLVTHLAGWLAINYSLGNLKAAHVSVSLLAQVPLTALLAIPLLGENLNSNQILGGILVLIGIYTVNKKRKENEKI